MFELNFKILANYNKITNEYMNNYIRDISEDQWNKNFIGYFKSIHELCSHIYICDFNWLKRFKMLRLFETLNNEYFNKNYEFSEIIFKNIQEYFLLRNELDQIIIDFINELEKNDLENILKFTDSKGNKIERKMEPLIIHMFNHQTHHRGRNGFIIFRIIRNREWF
ncbi:MAG: DinB family protein [Treponema sp.]|jgi:uncharacterized damage-inducible protein DinB|nr:DinB family protein [Treponema sp.]